MLLNATFNNISSVISWRSVLLVGVIGVPGENHWPAARLFFVVFYFKSTSHQIYIVPNMWPRLKKKGPDAVLPISHCVVVKFATSHNKNEHLVSYVKSTSHQIYIVPNNIIRLQFLLILRMFMYVLQMCGQVECRLRKGVLWFLP